MGQIIRPVWLLIAGPSGVGKSTMIEKMLAAYPDEILPVVTATTRARRPEETDGVQYYFLSDEDFSRREVAGEFYETIARHDVRYGTLKSEIRTKLAAGKSLAMHIDWKGARHIRELSRREGALGEAVVTVFIQPSSIEELRERLIKRGRNTSAEIEHRLREASDDLTHIDEFDATFVSTTPAEDFTRIDRIYRKITRGWDK